MRPTPTTNFGALRAQSVAVNDFNGHVLVADSGNPRRVYDFESPSDPTPAIWTGANTPLGSFGNARVSVAVDNATGAAYVASSSQKLIAKFDAAGNLVAGFGDTGPSADGQLKGLGTPAGTFLPATNASSPFPIAVDQATGNLYVVDSGHQVIDVFDSSGAYLEQITATPPGLYADGGNFVNAIAVNASTGYVYVAQWRQRQIDGPTLLFQFDGSGDYVSTWNGGGLPNGAASSTPEGGWGSSVISLATDDGDGRVFVLNRANETLDVFDSLGNFAPPEVTSLDLQSPGFTWLDNPMGIAFEAASGRLFVSTANRVQIFEPVDVPDVTVEPAADLTISSATLRAHLDPAGTGEITECRFEYLPAYQFHQNPRSALWDGVQQTPCEAESGDGAPFSAATDVIAEVSGLVTGTEYRFRLVVANEEGEVKLTGRPFAAAGSYERSDQFGSGGSGDGQLEGPQDVAVDESTGYLYVADTDNDRVVELDGEGGFLRAWGWGVADGSAAAQVCTAGCQAGVAGAGPGQFENPRYVEVDNSGGPSAGAVYVADTALGAVQKFSPAGELLTPWGEGGRVDFTKEGPITGITVSSSGDLYVGSGTAPYVWTQLGQDGVSRRELSNDGFSGVGSSGDGGIEVDRMDGLYATQPSGASISVGVKYLAYNEYFGNPGASRSFYPNYRRLPNSGIALDRASGDLYVSQGSHVDRFPAGGGCPLPGVAEESCGPGETFGLDQLAAASGLAFSSVTNRLYVADAGADQIQVFSRRPVPAVSTANVTQIGPTTATLRGHVAPQSGQVTDCHFEYGTNTTYELGTVPCSPSAPIGAPTEVTAGLSGLSALTTYHFRLVASGESELPARGADQSFTPAYGSAPSVVSASATGITPTTATLGSTIRTNQAPTVYRFQYGSTTRYGTQTALSDPLPGDGADHSVAMDVAHLEPGRVYHFRVLATNFSGTTPGPDQVFTTPSSPKVIRAGAAAITASSAVLSAQIQPGFSPTSFQFEYGPSASYGSSVGGAVGSDNLGHDVSRTLAGLAPATAYHFRVVATNAVAQIAGPDRMFVTLPAPPPPAKACRRPRVVKRGRCVRPRKRCGKGRVKRKGKCVKRRKARSRTHRTGGRKKRGGRRG